MSEEKVITVYLTEPALRELINLASRELLRTINHGHVDIELAGLLNKLAIELHDTREQRIGVE